MYTDRAWKNASTPFSTISIQVIYGSKHRDWLKTKVGEIGVFVITGFSEGAGRLEAIAAAELKDGVLVPVGMVKFGFARKHPWSRLGRLRAGPANRASLVPVRPELVAGVKFFGRAARARSATACC